MARARFQSGRAYFLLDATAALLALVVAVAVHPRSLALVPALGPWPFLAVALTPVLLLVTGQYRTIWDTLGLDELARSTGWSFLSLALALGGCVVLRSDFPPSLAVLSLVLALGFQSLLRLQRRRSSRLSSPELRGTSDKILVLGAGEAARAILADLRASGHLHLVTGLLDDDEAKHGMRILGVKVLGRLDQVREIADRTGSRDLVVAVQNLPGEKIRSLLDRLDLSVTRLRIVPARHESLLETLTVQQTREVRPEDLLGRRPAELNHDLIRDVFADRTVLITGAAGSIGSEICHQLLSLPIRSLVCVTRSEFSLYRLQEKLGSENLRKIPILYRLGDVRDRARLEEIFKEGRPDFVFHAAAHKHVPYMETHEKEAIKNNVLGTRNVLEASERAGAERFVLVSTDKAVRPTNVMGASKRLAEYTVMQAAARGVRASLVRFGNVLGSKGSVVPLFRKQILAGGPITVTDPAVVRYFMTVQEAALLVVNAGALLRGGERFILDMGEPVKIDDLVRRMIRLYRLEPDEDIMVRYTGLRPGEKLVEELLTATEHKRRTANPRIWEITDDAAAPAGFEEWLATIEGRLDAMTGEDVRVDLRKWVPDFLELR